MKITEMQRRSRVIAEHLLRTKGSLVICARPWAHYHKGKIIDAAFGFTLPRGKYLRLVKRSSYRVWDGQRKAIHRFDRTVPKQQAHRRGDKYWVAVKASTAEAKKAGIA